MKLFDLIENRRHTTETPHKPTTHPLALRLQLKWAQRSLRHRAELAALQSRWNRSTLALFSGRSV